MGYYGNGSRVDTGSGVLKMGHLMQHYIENGSAVIL